MTPLDKTLDHSLLLKDSPLTLYRLSARKYATSLSGLGAALYPGRWNAPGQEAIYTSTQIAVCVLERLVHTPKDRIPSDLALMTILLSGNWVWSLPQTYAQDRTTASGWSSFTTLRQAHAKWSAPEALDDRRVALAVPSVIVPIWNVVLYPRAAGFWNHVSLVSVEAFDYDPRLFPEDAVPGERLP